MQKHLLTVVESWGTKIRFNLSGYLWFLGMLTVLVALNRFKGGLFLVPAFLATLSIIHLLPEHPISQPYAVVAGSVTGAGIGALMTVFGQGTIVAAIAAAVAFVFMHVIRAYHPPGVALALYTTLLHPGAAFPLLVVLPFTLIAVISAAFFSRLNPHSPKYPVAYGTKPRVAW